MLEYVDHGNAQIKVFGVGGGGSNAVECMIKDQVRLENITFICANTDAQALQNSSASVKIQLGASITSGLGAGADPEVGERSALEDKDRIREVLEGADMVFIAAGMGGGTGTGAAPIVAQIAKDLGVLTVAVVTKPLNIEGAPRMRSAERGIQELRQHVDSLIEIPNQRLLAQSERGMGLAQTFAIANKILIDAVRGITEIIHNSGIINVDFADVRTIMSNQGSPNTLMGTGIGRGEQRAISAAAAAVSSPLLNHDISQARAVLMNFTGGLSMSLNEITEAAETVTREIEGTPQVILGAVVDESESFDDETIKVTVIATGFAEPPAPNIGEMSTGLTTRYGGEARRSGVRSAQASAAPMRSVYGGRGGQEARPYKSTVNSAPPTHRDSAPVPEQSAPHEERPSRFLSQNDRSRPNSQGAQHASVPPVSYPERSHAQEPSLNKSTGEYAAASPSSQPRHALGSATNDLRVEEPRGQEDESVAASVRDASQVDVAPSSRLRRAERTRYGRGGYESRGYGSAEGSEGRRTQRGRSRRGAIAPVGPDHVVSQDGQAWRGRSTRSSGSYNSEN